MDKVCPECNGKGIVITHNDEDSHFEACSSCKEGKMNKEIQAKWEGEFEKWILSKWPNTVFTFETPKLRAMNEAYLIACCKRQEEIDEKTVALQKADEARKTIQDHTNNLGKTITEQTIVRLELEAKLQLAEALLEMERKLKASAREAYQTTLERAEKAEERVKHYKEFIKENYPSDHWDLVLKVESMKKGIRLYLGGWDKDGPNYNTDILEKLLGE